MGYESRIYVVNVTHGWLEDVDGEDMFYAETIAKFNLCVVPEVADKMRKYYDSNIYILEGDERVFEDCYGDRLPVIPIGDAIQIIEDAMAEDDYYRRYAPCLEMLKAFNPEDWEDLKVLHYGY